MTTYSREEQAQNRVKWVEALRSGEYKQGKDQLRGGDRFCCLGVACEVSGLPYNPEDGALGDEVRDWLGLVDMWGVLTGGTGETLTNLNDNLDYTFDQIATLIESGEVAVQ